MVEYTVCLNRSDGKSEFIFMYNDLDQVHDLIDLLLEGKPHLYIEFFAREVEK